MIQEVTQQRYLGVLCSRCKEPIAVPNRAAVRYKRHELGEVSEDQSVGSRAFTLRCKACDGESVYRLDEIQDFEGKPRIRRPVTKKAAGAK